MKGPLELRRPSRRLQLQLDVRDDDVQARADVTHVLLRLRRTKRREYEVKDREEETPPDEGQSRCDLRRFVAAVLPEVAVPVVQVDVRLPVRAPRCEALLRLDVAAEALRRRARLRRDLLPRAAAALRLLHLRLRDSVRRRGEAHVGAFIPVNYAVHHAAEAPRRRQGPG
eukprot:gene25025-biopygen17968